jgi:hypothetical protein
MRLLAGTPLEAAMSNEISSGLRWAGTGNHCRPANLRGPQIDRFG